MPRRQVEHSAAKLVRDWIDGHPSVKDCMKLRVINLSALARLIMDDTGIQSEEAALVACRRYELDPSEKINEEQILRVLRRSKIEMRTKVSIITARPDWEIFAKLEKTMNALRGRSFALHVIQGSESVTLITDGAIADEIEGIVGKQDLIKRENGLVELVVTSPDVIEEVPGILAYLSSALASRGINFLEVISCYKDTMFVIEETDMVKAFDVLNRMTVGR
ncbi:MAG TPA: ACT domain-containing protein [Candidatus Thermoplasmatota archaeon]|nr:ACT domain-containing protein [Candidatus Thermoplasmatota archaeon]